MALDLGVLPDINYTAHETVDIQRQKVLVALDCLMVGISWLQDYLVELFNANAFPYI